MSDRLANKLKARATAWAGQLTKLAKSFAPNHVQPAIHSYVETKENGQYIIRITADRKVAPDARAQEFGSGLHAKRGAKQKYTIEPKNKKYLAFHWDLANEIIADDLSMGKRPKLKFLPDGRVILRSVQHPGIEAANGGQGYIAPAMKELRARAREQLTDDVREAIMGDVRESFGRKTR